jgi:hypothetical protein
MQRTAFVGVVLSSFAVIDLLDGGVGELGVVEASVFESVGGL